MRLFLFPQQVRSQQRGKLRPFRRERVRLLGVALLQDGLFALLESLGVPAGLDKGLGGTPGVLCGRSGSRCSQNGRRA